MSSESLKPGLPITSLEEFISTVRILNNRSIYNSKPRTRFFDSSVKYPDPFVDFDGKPISRLYLESHTSVSQYDWYHSFTLCFHDDLSSPPSSRGCDGFISRNDDENGGSSSLKEIRGYGYLDFRACQRVYYTAYIESFVLNLVEDEEEQKQEGEGDDIDWKSDQVTLVDREKSFGAKLVGAIKQHSPTTNSSSKKTQDGEAEKEAGKEKKYTFNLKITTRPESSLSNWHKVRFGYYDLEESESLRRTYDIRFNAEKGIWPNTNGYCEYDYLVKIDTDKSPFPETAKEALKRGEYIWEKVFLAKINEPNNDE